MKQNAQFISHSLELIDDYHPTIAQFKVTLMLLLPKSLIATDIKTGFPNLIRKERLNIDAVILEQFKRFNQQVNSIASRPLVYADEFVQILEKVLPSFFQEHSQIDLLSINITIDTDVYQQTANLINFSHKLKNGDT